MKLIRRIIFSLGLLLTLSVPLAYAQSPINNEICNDPANQGSAFCQENSETRGGEPTNNRIYGPNGIITKVVRILSIVIGVAAVLMIIVGGIRYITSSGDPANVNGAKNTILYAIIGLVIAVFAQGLIVFVVNKL